MQGTLDNIWSLDLRSVHTDLQLEHVSCQIRLQLRPKHCWAAMGGLGVFTQSLSSSTLIYGTDLQAESRRTQDEEETQQDSEGAEAGGRHGEVDMQLDKRREEPVEATDARDANQDEKISETAASQDSVKLEAKEDSAGTQVSQQEKATGNGRLSKGIWVIDLTDDEPALKDGEDTPMVGPITRQLPIFESLTR